MKKSTIYSKKGDQGNTSLASMTKISKATVRLEVFGTIDELNSNLGFVCGLTCEERTKEILQIIQYQLFSLGSDLAYEDGTHPAPLKRIDLNHIEMLETFIDEIDSQIAPLREFILPGGSLSGSQLHISRTVCRRAERNLVRFLQNDSCNPAILPYLNRLSDLLFVLARYENHCQKIKDIPFKK